MLKRILSIAGKPGLYELVSQGKNMLIVEALETKKRTPAYAHERVISLADIAMFTEDGEVPLVEVFCTIKEKYNAEKVGLNSKSSNQELFDFFAEILPNFDRNRVYPTDVKKLVNWYNILVSAGKTDLMVKQSEGEGSEE